MIIEPAQRVQQLHTVLEQHSRSYSSGSPEISDAMYDALMAELRSIERERPDLVCAWSPTQRVMESLSGLLPARKHSRPMLSLSNAFNADDVEAWIRKMVKLSGSQTGWTLTVQPKIDGLSVALVDERGVFVQALTRGNGCLDGACELEFSDGRRLPIQEVVTHGIVGEVKCYDTTKGTVEWQPITDFYENDECDDWLEISAADGDGEVRTISLTRNHQVFVVGRGYVRADALLEGDMLLDG